MSGVPVREGSGGTVAVRRFAPTAPGGAAFWAAAADVLVPWLQAAAADGVAPALVVPRGALVAPLQRALRQRLAAPGRPWAPPPIRPCAAWADELVPAVPVDALARTLSLLEALDAALPDAMPQRAPADRLAFAGGLLEVLDAFAQAGAAGRLGDPAWIATVVDAFGSPAAEERLREDLSLLARIARATDGGGSDPTAQGIERMRRLAAAWAARGAAIAWIAWQPPEPLEAVLIAELEARLPAGRLLRLEPDWAAIGRVAPLIAAAWPECVGTAPPAPLRDRRRGWAARPVDTLGPVPVILHAADREREAQLAAQWVHARLADAARDPAAPVPSLAIVALDRWLARRVRALLERAGVLIDDREGWLLSTTVAATAAMGWLDAVAADGYYDDLLGWLDSRFLRPPGGLALRDWIERRATGHGYLRGWDGLQGDADTPSPEALARLRELAARQARPQSLRAHLDALEDAMRWAGAPRRLAGDAAGRQLLSRLESLRRTADSDGHARALPFAEFRALLAMTLERHRFYGPIESPVELLTPVDAAGRGFDAVLVLGASDAALPAAPGPLPLVNEPLRALIGLPTAASAAASQQRDLALLLALAPASAMTCRTDPGDGTRPSPWVERFEAITTDATLAGREDRPGLPRELLPRRASRPGLALHGVPPGLSVGAIERLVACPFRFLVQDGWRLREADVPVDVPGVRERGELVHELLERFHREAPARGVVLDAGGVARARALLVEITDAVAARELATGGGALGELAEWRATIDAYLEWAVADAALGWTWRDGERAAAIDVGFDALDGPRTVRVEGRLDRLDEGPGGLRVVDYKLGDPARLRRIAAKPDQAAQLALYALMAAETGEVAQSGYLSLRRDGVKWVPLSQPTATVLAGWRDRLPAVLARIHDGEALHATGVECGHCASRGLCRKGHWS
ncbi:MAG: PD-(D/E)XK nuclease family protein [Burkholderiales bacterium]|nr:MAG: PD-(D/E)XK nuclease family protein [Burkholderiales bacterium]